MNLENTYYVGELVGVVAVVVTLIYVALQVRQNTHATMLSTAHDCLEQVREGLVIIAQDADLAEIYLRGLSGSSSLSPSDRLRFNIFLHYQYRAYENAHFQTVHGVVDPSIWNGLTHYMSFTKGTPGHIEFWNNRKQIFNPSFQRFFEDEVAISPSELVINLYKEQENVDKRT